MVRLYDMAWWSEVMESLPMEPTKRKNLGGKFEKSLQIPFTTLRQQGTFARFDVFRIADVADSDVNI